MEKEDILDFLSKNDVENKENLIDFLNQSEYYSRSNDIGHITASAFILDNEMQSVLLILHKKYEKWLTPGGHVDNGENSLIAAKRETSEEVGLNKLDLLIPKIFDIDIHKIPEALKNGKLEKEHWHFDIRYLFKSQKNAIVDINLFEANGFNWRNLKDVSNSNDISLRRQSLAAIKIIKNLKNTKKMKP